jgi:hypothetical protein
MNLSENVDRSRIHQQRLVDFLFPSRATVLVIKVRRTDLLFSGVLNTHFRAPLPS